MERGCRFVSTAQKSKLVGDFLREFGDGLPEEAIRKATQPKSLKRWHLVCDPENNQKISSGVYWEQSDWYLCTMKNLATRPSERGKGLATEVVTSGVKQAIRAPNCHVLAADITTTNTASQRVFEKAGFSKVNKFCWAKGQKPANVLHYVVMRPDKEDKCS